MSFAAAIHNSRLESHCIVVVPPESDETCFSWRNAANLAIVAPVLFVFDSKGLSRSLGIGGGGGGGGGGGASFLECLSREVSALEWNRSALCQMTRHRRHEQASLNLESGRHPRGYFCFPLPLWPSFDTYQLNGKRRRRGREISLRDPCASIFYMEW